MRTLGLQRFGKPSALVSDLIAHIAVSRFEVIPQQISFGPRVVALFVLNNQEAAMHNDFTPIDSRTKLQIESEQAFNQDVKLFYTNVEGNKTHSNASPHHKLS